MCDIYHNLKNELKCIDESVSAIQMTPSLHQEIIKNLADGQSALEMNGLPIVFIHGEKNEYTFLNSQQHRLRIRHNEILGLYDRLCKRLSNIINSGYMVNGQEELQDDMTRDLKKFVKRLDIIEEQITISGG